MTRSEKALDCFDSGFYCSQAVLTAFADEHGLSQDMALKVATALSGGKA